MKRICCLILIAVMLTGSVLRAFPAVAAEPFDWGGVDYTSRKDFVFGINTHAQDNTSYPAEYLDEQIHLVAKAGCKMIRINGQVIGADFDYQDRVVGLCNKYGLKIIMVFKPPIDMGLDVITDTCKTLAERYNGKNGRGFVDYIQVWNEMDAALKKAKDGGGGGGSGKKMTDFYTIPVEGFYDLPEWTEYYMAAAKGIHAADSDTKFMVNFCYHLWGMILWFLKEGVPIDVIGWDLYPTKADLNESHNLIVQDLDEFERDVYNKYHIPVIICETGTYNTSDYGTVLKTIEDTRKIENHYYMFDVIKETYKRNWIRGLAVYELLDEPTRSGKESRWGIVNCGSAGVIGEPKTVYRELQRIWGGNDNTIKYSKNNIDRLPYAIFDVDTADDSGVSGQNTDASDGLISGFIDADPDDDGFASDDEIGDLTPKTKNRTQNMKVTENRYVFPWAMTILSCAGLAIIAAFIMFFPDIMKKYKMRKSRKKEILK